MRAQRFYTWGYTDIEAVAHEALIEAVQAIGGAAAPASPPAAQQQGAFGVKPEVATPLPAPARGKRPLPMVPFKRPREAVPEDVAALREKRLAALAARGVETGAPVAGHSGSGAAGDAIELE